MHDAALHAIQACIPAATLLPTGIERLSLRTSKISGPVFVQARERSNEENNFIYDVSVTDVDGAVLESWDGLQLTAIEGRQINQVWIEPLLSPYLERCFRDLFPSSDVSVALVRDKDTDHQARSAKAIRMLLGEESEILRRPDGKPEVAGERSVSTSHHGDLTLAVAGMGQVSCDIEPVVERSPCLWQALLGKERIRLAQFIERSADENPLNGTTRVWAAGECLKKVGGLIAAPLTFLRSTADGWILVSSGRLKIATYAAQIQNEPKKIIIAILTQIP
jgi:enediyne polyketide synthase